MNLAFGTNTSLLDLIALLEGQLGQSLQTQHVEPRVGDVKASQADSGRLRSLFSDVVPVSLEEGTSRTIEWFRASLAV